MKTINTKNLTDNKQKESKKDLAKDLRIALVSDLHLECCEIDLDFKDADVLIFAGDIMPISQGNVVDYLKNKYGKYKNIIFVPGNHDYYGGIFKETENEWRAAAKNSNVNVLINNTITIDGVDFIGAPLFTNFKLKSIWPVNALKDMVERGISDFSRIMIDASNFIIPNDYVNFFNESVNFIEKELSERNSNEKIVITHWPPSEKSLHQKYKNNPYNPYFINSGLDKLFVKPKYWLHGHTHDAFNYKILNTKIVCNPRGYVFMYGDEIKQENFGDYKPYFFNTPIKNKILDNTNILENILQKNNLP